MCGLQVVKDGGDARLQLAQRQVFQRLAHHLVAVLVLQRAEVVCRLAHFLGRLHDLLAQLHGFLFDALDFIQRLKRRRQIFGRQFVLRGVVFLFAERVELRLHVSARRKIAARRSRLRRNGRQRAEHQQNGKKYSGRQASRKDCVLHNHLNEVMAGPHAECLRGYWNGAENTTALAHGIAARRALRIF